MAEPRRQQDRARLTRERLLDAAVECLAELGYAGTTTSAVCERAGLSRGAQLHHFPSKRELLVGAVQHLLETRIARMRTEADALQGTADPVRAVVEGIWSNFTGPLWYAAAELWIAARTDPELHATLYPVERQVGHEIHAAFHKIFPPDVAGAPGFDAALDAVIYVMRGLAMTRILRDDPAEQERVIGLCVDLLNQSS